jgi:hypothetical protein
MISPDFLCFPHFLPITIEFLPIWCHSD